MLSWENDLSVYMVVTKIYAMAHKDVFVAWSSVGSATFHLHSKSFYTNLLRSLHMVKTGMKGRPRICNRGLLCRRPSSRSSDHGSYQFLFWGVHK